MNFGMSQPIIPIFKILDDEAGNDQIHGDYIEYGKCRMIELKMINRDQ